jgi:hypothetical protein
LVELDAQLASSEDGRAREAIRALVGQIVVQPGSARGGKRWLMQFCVVGWSKSMVNLPCLSGLCC